MAAGGTGKKAEREMEVWRLGFGNRGVGQKERKERGEGKKSWWRTEGLRLRKREVWELERKNRGKEEWRLRDRGCKVRNQKNRGGRIGKGKESWAKEGKSKRGGWKESGERRMKEGGAAIKKEKTKASRRETKGRIPVGGWRHNRKSLGQEHRTRIPFLMIKTRATEHPTMLLLLSVDHHQRHHPAGIHRRRLRSLRREPCKLTFSFTFQLSFRACLPWLCLFHPADCSWF